MPWVDGRVRHGGTPAWKCSTERLLAAGLLDWTGEVLVTSSKGAAMIDMILATPVPVEKFVDPRFEKTA